MRRSLVDLEANADAIADAFENYDPQSDDVDAPLPPLMAVKLAAFRRAQAEKDLAGTGGETINGVPVTAEQIADRTAEAEAGDDVAALKRRGRGRPGRGGGPSQVVALRLTAQELAAVDARAELEGKTRSEVIREALGVATP